MGNVTPDTLFDWVSSDTLVLYVSPYGRIVSLSQGSALVTASAGGARGNLLALVRQQPVAMELAITLRVLASQSAQITVRGRDVNEYPLSQMWGAWTSSDGTVATVDSVGVVLGPRAGQRGDRAGLPPFTDTARVIVAKAATDITVGPFATYSCALTAGGVVYSWRAAVTGSGDVWLQSLRPAAVPPAAEFRALATGTEHACALDGDGAAYCWGNNDSGQLGDGSTVSRPAGAGARRDRIRGPVGRGGAIMRVDRGGNRVLLGRERRRRDRGLPARPRCNRREPLGGQGLGRGKPPRVPAHDGCRAVLLGE
jgi:hypothetical protein